MATNYNMPILLSGNSLVKNESFGSVEDMIPLVMLSPEKQQALEELRINAVYRLASGFITTTWRTYVCDRSMGKKLPVDYYTSNPVGIAELKQMEHLLNACDYIKHQVDELTTHKAEDRLEYFLVGYDKEELLNELLHLPDAEFCRCLHRHKKAHHFRDGINCAALARALKHHFSNIPASSMITPALEEDVPDVKPRKARKPVTRVRID